MLSLTSDHATGMTLCSSMEVYELALRITLALGSVENAGEPRSLALSGSEAEGLLSELLAIDQLSPTRPGPNLLAASF